MRRMTAPYLPRILALAATALVALSPGYGQARLDIGIAVPRGVGAVVSGGFISDSSFMSNGNSGIFPFPEAAIHYQFGEGSLAAGVGARAFSLIVETVAWPNAFAELDLGPVVLEAQVGGGAFLLFGLYNDFQVGRLFFPDLSAWVPLGKKRSFRLGAGCLGFFLPDTQPGALPFVFYLGGKFSSTL